MSHRGMGKLLMPVAPPLPDIPAGFFPFPEPVLGIKIFRAVFS
jgi:hypothetical protein